MTFGFDEINEFEDYAFLVDEYTVHKNKLKLLYFITNLPRLIEDKIEEIIFHKINLPIIRITHFLSLL